MKISESFYSIQGEGDSLGVPAYFVRLQGCNLNCQWCDTTEVWKRGEEVSNAGLLKRIEDAGALIGLLKGTTHLVWTGGEPTLPHHQRDIMGFLNYINKQTSHHLLFSEVETNGTLETAPEFYQRYVNQINCSPKLSNIGKRPQVNPKAIKQISAHGNSWFKFVIDKEEDIVEMEDRYIKPFGILHWKVLLMPQVSKREDLPERTRFMFDMSKKYGYRNTTRLHVTAYDKLTGV